MKYPVSRSVDLSTLKLPCRLTWIANEWHINEEYIPTAVYAVPEVNMNDTWFECKLNQYLFQHSLLDIIMYNKPSVFTNASQSESEHVCEFYVPIEEGNFLVVPRLPIINNENRIRFWLTLGANQEPQLKISVDLKEQ